MNKTDRLLTLIAQATLFLQQQVANYKTLKLVNNMLFVLDSDDNLKMAFYPDGRIVKDNKVLKLLYNKYNKEGYIYLDENLKVEVPVLFSMLKHSDIGRYRIFLFVNDDYKRREGIVALSSTAENETLDEECDTDTKSMSAVIVVDKENNKIEFSCIEKIKQQYVVFDPINNAVWSVNTINNSIKVSIVHPDYIETQQFKPVRIVLPQTIEGNLWNSAPAPVSGKQYGIFMEDNNSHVGLLTVINKKVVFLPFLHKELRQFRRYEEEGYLISKLNAVIVNNSNYVLYIEMERNLVHIEKGDEQSHDVKKLTVKQGMENFTNIDKNIKGDNTSVLLLDKQGSTEIFVVFKMHDINHYSADIIAVDTLHNKVKKLHHAERDFFYDIQARIKNDYVWLLFEYRNPKNVYVYNKHTGELYKVYTQGQKEGNKLKGASHIRCLQPYDKEHIYFTTSSKDNYDATVTLINTASFEKQTFVMKDFNRYSHYNYYDVIRNGNDLILGCTSTRDSFQVYYIIHNNKLFSFIDEKTKLPYLELGHSCMFMDKPVVKENSVIMKGER